MNNLKSQIMVMGAEVEKLGGLLYNIGKRFNLVNPRDCGFLSIYHDWESIRFPEQNLHPKKIGNLLISRFRNEKPNPSILVPQTSPYDFIEKLREHHLETAKECFRQFSQRFAGDITNQNHGVAYSKMMERMPAFFNYMMHLIKNHSIDEISFPEEDPQMRIIRTAAATYNGVNSVDFLYQGGQDWTSWLDFPHLRFQAGDTASDRDGGDGINLINICGVNYGYAYVNSDDTKKVLTLSKKITDEEGKSSKFIKDLETLVV